MSHPLSSKQQSSLSQCRLNRVQLCSSSHRLIAHSRCLVSLDLAMSSLPQDSTCPKRYFHCWYDTLPLSGSVVPAKFSAIGLHDSELPNDGIITVSVDTLPVRGSVVQTKLSASGMHVSSFRMERDVYIRKNMYANAVLSSDTYIFHEVYARMTKELMASAQSAMSIKVGAPPDGNIITVCAKHFHCYEVLFLEKKQADFVTTLSRAT